MKKTYTRKHICEAIAYWENQLKMMNESSPMLDRSEIDFDMGDYPAYIILAIPKRNPADTAIYPVDENSLRAYIKRMDLDDQMVSSLFGKSYPYNIFTQELNDFIIKIMPSDTIVQYEYTR